MQALLRPPVGVRGKALRLWGYRRDPAAKDAPEFFRCVDTCRKRGTRVLDPDRQAAWCCALPGFDRNKWRPEGLHLYHMGAPPRYDREPSATFEGDGDWHEPVENPDFDGCPGSYVYSPFVGSVLKYRRRPAGEGSRTPNRLLDLCDDELVLEAVEFLETCEDAWQNEHERWRIANMRAESAGD